MVEQRQSPEQVLDALLQAKKQAKEKLLDFRKEFAALIKDEDTPVALALFDIRSGLSSSKSVIFDSGQEEDVTFVREEWDFIQQGQFVKDISSLLLPELNLRVNKLAAKIGIDNESVLDAAIKTEVLAYNFQNSKDRRPLFLELNEGPEGLRLGDNLWDVLNKERKVISVERIGYRLEYYFSFARIKREPVRSLLLPVPLAKIDFPSLFPEILLMSTLLARQNSALSLEQ